MSDFSQLSAQDQEVVQAAFARLKKSFDGSLHTVASAARTQDGKLVSGMNLRHYAAMNCSEITLLHTVQNTTNAAITVILGARYINDEPTIVNLCGRCQQVLGDCYPDVRFIINDNGVVRSVSLAEALPFPYTSPKKGLKQ